MSKQSCYILQSYCCPRAYILAGLSEVFSLCFWSTAKRFPEGKCIYLFKHRTKEYGCQCLLLPWVTGYSDWADSLKQICFYLTGHGEVQHVSSGPCQNQTEALQALLFVCCSAGSTKWTWKAEERAGGCYRCTESKCSINADISPCLLSFLVPGVE